MILHKIYIFFPWQAMFYYLKINNLFNIQTSQDDFHFEKSKSHGLYQYKFLFHRGDNIVFAHFLRILFLKRITFYHNYFFFSKYGPRSGMVSRGGRGGGGALGRFCFGGKM